MWRPARANKIKVLSGVNEQNALYPRRLALLADAVGNKVTIARRK
jgi:hypothetical protein